MIINKRNRKGSFRMSQHEEIAQHTIIQSPQIKDAGLPAQSNDLYLYEPISADAIFNLNQDIDGLSKQLRILQINYNLLTCPHINLYVSSEGGDIFPALSTIDRILSEKVPIHTIIEGLAASSATLITVCAAKRYIRKNSFILIHQLSSGFWGNYAEIKDEMQNLDALMERIKNIYKKYTKLTDTQLDEILKHDIYFDADKALEFGLVDEII